MTEEGTTTKAPKAGWGPTVAIAFTVLTYFFSQFLAGIAVSVYPLLQHWTAKQTTEWLGHSIAAQFAFVILAEGLMLVLLWQFLKRRRLNFKHLGFNNRRLKAQDIGRALIGFVVYLALFILAVSLAKKIFPGLNVDQTQQTGFEQAHGDNQLVLVFISLVLIPPFVEEIITRGFLYKGLKQGLPKAAAVIITSLLFAAAHLQWGSGAALLWIAAIDTFTLSLVLIYLVEKTGSLWASICLHMLKNGIAFFALFVFK